jgi:hypothetical protein
VVTNAMQSRCRSLEADTTFLFLGFLASAAAVGLWHMAHKRGAGKGLRSAV